MRSAQDILEGLKIESACRGNVEDLEEKRKKEALKNTRESRLKRIPKRYANATFDSFKVTNLVQQLVIDFLRSGRSCITFGPNGTGKTHLAYAAIKHQINQDNNARYILAADYFDLIRKSFSETVPELKQYENCDYLVIDEIDKRYGSQTEFISLYRLINHRYNDMKPTVIITNSNKEELIDVIGSSSFDRIREDGEIFFLAGDSWRGKKVKTNFGD